MSSQTSDSSQPPTPFDGGMGDAVVAESNTALPSPSGQSTGFGADSTTTPTPFDGDDRTSVDAVADAGGTLPSPFDSGAPGSNRGIGDDAGAVGAIVPHPEQPVSLDIANAGDKGVAGASSLPRPDDSGVPA